MKSKFLKATIALTIALSATSFAAEDNFALKGNIQTQATANNEDDGLKSFWFRANVGGMYKSESFDAQVMLRIFGPHFGNTIDGKSYDKILADLLGKLQVFFGRSQSEPQARSLEDGLVPVYKLRYLYRQGDRNSRIHDARLFP